MLQTTRLLQLVARQLERVQPMNWSQQLMYSTSSKSGIHNLASKPSTETDPKSALNLDQVAVPDLQFNGSDLPFKGLETDFPCLLRQ